MPVETFQMMEFLSKKSEDEFKHPNIVCISDDEETLMAAIKQGNLEQ